MANLVKQNFGGVIKQQKDQSVIEEWLEPAPSNLRVLDSNAARATLQKYTAYLISIFVAEDHGH